MKPWIFYFPSKYADHWTIYTQVPWLVKICCPIWVLIVQWLACLHGKKNLIWSSSSDYGKILCLEILRVNLFSYFKNIYSSSLLLVICFPSHFPTGKCLEKLIRERCGNWIYSKVSEKNFLIQLVYGWLLTFYQGGYWLL